MTGGRLGPVERPLIVNSIRKPSAMKVRTESGGIIRARQINAADGPVKSLDSRIGRLSTGSSNVTKEAAAPQMNTRSATPTNVIAASGPPGARLRSMRQCMGMSCHHCDRLGVLRCGPPPMAR